MDLHDNFRYLLVHSEVQNKGYYNFSNISGHFQYCPYGIVLIKIKNMKHKHCVNKGDKN